MVYLRNMLLFHNRAIDNKNLKMLKTMKLSKIFLFSFIFLFFISLASSSLALEAGALGIRPANPDPTQPFGKSWFIYTAEIGKEIQDKVDVINLADVPVRAKVWAADAVTTPDGAYTIKEKEETRDIGTWIIFFEKVIEEGKEKIVDLGSEVTIDLEGNEIKTLDFKIVVPENAEVGDHMGAIMTQSIGTLAELEKGEAEIAPGVKVVTRIGARVYLTVAGETVKILEFPKFSWEMKNKKFYFLLSLKNKGNVRIEPRGEITIKNILGAKIDELTIPTRIVFPKGEIVIPVEWEKIPFWAKYGGFTAEAKVIYGPGLELTKVLKAIALPWHVPAIFGGIILLIILLLVVKMMVAKKEKKMMKEYIIGSGETIESIAQKFGMNWKKLAKINRLKPPYTLKKGQKIFVLEK